MTSQAGQDIRGGLWHIVEMVGEEALEHHGAGELDELTVGSWLRAEWMEGRTWWLRIGDARIVANTESGRTCVDVQRGFYDAVRGTTTAYSPAPLRRSHITQPADGRAHGRLERTPISPGGPVAELGTVEALGSWIRFAAAEPVRAIGVKPWPTADLLDLLVPSETPPPAIGDAVVVLAESPATPELRDAGRAGRSDATSDEAS